MSVFLSSVSRVNDTGLFDFDALCPRVALFEYDVFVQLFVVDVFVCLLVFIFTFIFTFILNPFREALVFWPLGISS